MRLPLIILSLIFECSWCEFTHICNMVVIHLGSGTGLDLFNNWIFPIYIYNIYIVSFISCKGRKST